MDRAYFTLVAADGSLQSTAEAFVAKCSQRDSVSIRAEQC